MDQLPVRRSGKVLLVNQERQLLLFRGDVPESEETSREIWFPVGGGVEGDESFAECASRELFEETGMALKPEELGPVVAVRSGSFILNGEEIWSDEAFYFVSIPEWSVDLSGFTPLERQVVTDHRWWPLAELMTTDLEVYPPPRELATFVARLCAFGPCGEVAELSWSS